MGGDDDATLLATDGDLLAEAAAHVLLHDPDLVIGDPEQCGGAALQHVWHLGRDVYEQLAGVGLPVGKDRPSLHRDLHLSLCPDRLSDDGSGTCKRVIELGSFGLGNLDSDIGAEMRVHKVLRLDDGPLQVEHGWQRLQVECHELTRIFGEVATLRHDQHNRVAHIAHVGAREQAGAIGLGHPCGRVDVVARHGEAVETRLRHAVDVGCGEDSHDALGGGGRRGADPEDPTSGHRGPDERAVERSGPDDIVDEHALASQQPGVLAAQHRLPDEPTGRAGRAHGAPTTRRTARTIPW